MRASMLERVWFMLLILAYGYLAVMISGPWLGRLTDTLFGPETKLYWWLSRAAAIVAYTTLTASMALGVGITTRLSDVLTPRFNTFTLHNHLAWLAWGFSGLHALLLTLDTYTPFSVTELLVPLTSHYRAVPVALGVLGFYGLGLLTLSFYLKPRISQRAWRAIHYVSFGVFVFVTAHGLLAGSGTGFAWMQWWYLLSGGLVLFLVLYRILLGPRDIWMKSVRSGS